MKNNILKSIFLTIILLLGASHAAWGASYTIYFKNTVGWSNVYVHFYNDNASLGQNGMSGSGAAKNAGAMTKVNGTSDIYSITYEGDAYQKVCFTKDQQDNYNNFHQTECSYATGLNVNGSNLLWIPDANQTTPTNSCTYYNTGTWTTYSPASGGTIPKQIKGSFDSWNTHDFTESGGLYSYTYTNLSANTQYEFVVVPQNGDDFKNKNITKANPSAVLEQNGSNATIKTDVAGNYKFTWDPATNTITVTYPSSATVDECKLFYANESSGSHTGEMASYIVMQYDNVSAAYYADVTTAATYYCYRYQKTGHSSLYAANWNSYPKGTEVVANGAKVDANQDVSGWGDKSVCYYKGTSGDNIRIWIDYDNKKTWITKGVSSTYTVTIAAGEGGSVSPSGAQQVGSTPVTITATPNTGYDFVNWTVSGGATVASSTSATTTVTATATGTVTANFKASSTSVSYYYHDDKNTKWTGDGNVGTANSTEGYVYWEFSKNQYDDNNFKIFNCKPKPADEQAGQIHPNLIGYDDKIDNTLSNGGLTLTDPSGDNWHNILLPNTSGAYYIILYLPNSTYNTTSEYKVAIRVTLPGTTAATSYWYFDEENTGWSEKTPIADKWKFVDAGNYAYVLVPANNKSNKFKVFSCNPKNDSQLVANDGNIATGELAGDIALKNTDTDWHNIVIDAVPSDYYVILYYPNTSTNSSDKYLVAATYDLPGVQKYAVSFGVVGKTGGTITAKSGSSTITSGQLVSRATFTATPAAGYSVEGWYADAEGNNKITAAGTQTTYSQAITEANNTVYVKFVKTYAIYYKFNDQKWNDDYYAYIFTDEVWHNEKGGVQPKNNRSEYGQMTKYNDSVYYYKFTGSADYPRFAFSWGDKTGQDIFYQVSAVYRRDFRKDMPVFISQRGQAADVHNEAPYYNQGVWMRFNDTIPGYNLGLRNQTDNNGKLDESYRFTAAEPGDYISTVDVALVAGKTYSFLVKNDKDYYFTPNNATTCTPSNSHFELYKSDNKIEVVIKPTVTGTYTFQLNLANGKVEIDVLYPTTQYRLVYVEKNGSTIEKFHPSHIIKSHPEATKEAPMFDTVSIHVRLKLLQKKAAVSGTTDVKYDTIPNSNTCEVWLQEFKEDGGVMDWETIQTINTKENLTTNGVYNFIIAQGATTSIDPKTIHPYTGRYYIRTDASDGGRNNYKQLSNYCYYTEYSRVYRGFDYYFCRWASKENITYTIACDYSYCVSDTLAQEDHEPHSTYTDADGKLQHEANVRFMWHSFSNELDRAYIAGAGDNLYLMSAAGIYDMEGNQNSSAKLKDQQNWVYRVDVKADTKARIKLRAVPYNSATTYSWFRGRDGDGDFSDKNTEQLIEGKSGTKYTIRVIYDFKTDHLICAWIPDKDTITANDVINADLMIIRKDQGEAAQLNFKPNETQLTNITVAYCVLNLTRDSLKSEYLTPKEKSCYWVSFPFDVNLSDVFGCGKYGEDFIIQYYDGAERAQKGCWKDSPTYWKYITNPTGVVLKKGMGYVLVIDYAKILSEQFKHNNTSVNIYFPSSGPIDVIDGLLPTAVEVPKHECTITRNDRYIYDSNWNIIGIPTWANIDKFGNPMVAKQITSDLSQGGTAEYTIGFYYAHDAKNNKWTVCNTEKVDFLSMYSYLVQWAGTINWQEKSASGKHHPSSLAPRRYAPAAEEEGEATAPEQYTLRLTLHRGETQLDHTYIRLQEGNVTTDFDLNYDMTKILNSGANLYSLVGTQQIQCAANVQPLQEEARTISIPLGVVADQDGLYTFSLPEGTEGMNVSIADSESGTVHNLALGDYQTALSKGTYEGRFALEIQPRQGVSTGCEQTDAAGKSLRKVLIDGNLYILRDGKAYTAAGQEL